METKTNFLGNAKAIGNKIQVTLDYDKLLKMDKFKAESGKRYITVDVIPLKEANKFKQTHTVVEHVPYKKEEE